MFVCRLKECAPDIHLQAGQPLSKDYIEAGKFINHLLNGQFSCFDILKNIPATGFRVS